MRAYVGTSGWQYKDWKGRFYPQDLPARAWLEYYSSVFCTLEVNNAFYRLPTREIFARWAATTPAGFVIAVKASRYLTHIRRLREPKEPVQRLVERAAGLGDKLGPILLQLPPTLPIDLKALDECLSCFPSSIPVSVEARHDSWFVEDFASVLAAHNAALCLADYKGPTTPRWRTANWGYLRFHGGLAAPPPSYGEHALAAAAQSAAQMFPGEEPVFAYFNNDTLACAPRNAQRFARLTHAVAPAKGAPPPRPLTHKRGGGSATLPR